MGEFTPPLDGNGTIAARWRSGDYDDLLELRSKLLSHGGDEVVPALEDDIDKLISEGQLIEPRTVEFVDGTPSRCHENASLVFRNNSPVTKIGVGWALSDDGLWRQHSWAMVGRRKLIETTKEREQYFGFLLSGQEANQFEKRNIR